MLNHRCRFWLIFLPLVTLWIIVATDHHLSLWWGALAGAIAGCLCSWVAD